MAEFEASHKKIQRAYKHIEDINSLLRDFAKGDIHSVIVDHDTHTGQNFLRMEFREDLFPSIDCALIIGDALHNLRSALDFMWYEFVSAPTKWTRFPISDTGEELKARIKSALKQQQIIVSDGEFMVEKIQPYKSGNVLLWGLHDMNIRDKHHLFIPVVKLMVVFDVRLEDENCLPIGPTGFANETSFRLEITESINRKITVKNKGRPSAQIYFGEDAPFQNQSVIPALGRIAEEVTRTVKAFELL